MPNSNRHLGKGHADPIGLKGFHPQSERFAHDSALEGTGFELLVRGRVKLVVGRRRQRKSNGSTPPLSMRIGDLRSARTPHQGRRGKDIVVLDRWGEDRTEDAVSSLARSRPVSVL